MTTVTLGDLLRVADAHLQDAETARDGVIQPDAATARDLQALIRALAQYIDHVSPPLNPGDVVRITGDHARVWDYAAVEMREALRLAATALDGAGEPGHNDDERTPTAITRAAAALASGRDLLGVHFRRNSDGDTTEVSDWARVITSYPVSRALADEVSGWSQLLAPWVRWIAKTPRDDAVGELPKALTDAAHHLEFAGRAAFVARRADPVQEQDRELLYGIPAASGPRIAIQPGEPVAARYDGLSATAERLRGIAFNMATYSAWAPGITARPWRHTAMGAAVTSDIAARILHTLARRKTLLLDAGTSRIG